MNTEEFFLPTIKVDNGKLGNSGIYFLQSSEGYVKIGKTGNFNKRFSTYKTHNSTIRVVGFIWTVEKFLDWNECILHQLWSPFRVSGEWFAPVVPLVEYLSYFWHGSGLALENVDKPNTYQELIDAQRLDYEGAQEFYNEHADELRAKGWKL